MNKKWIGLVTGLLLVAFSGWAQEAASDTQPTGEPTVSITVQQSDMLSVLKFIADQADVNVVIGPEVAATELNIDITDVALTDALDVILKPHGYGYRAVGETIVVDKLDNLKRVADVEPLSSRVFKLKYIDAADVLAPVNSMLSTRGDCQVLYVAPKSGWEFSEGGDNTDTTAKAKRIDGNKQKKEESASKTLIVSDIPSVLTKIEQILEEVDVMPKQVEIRAYFIEKKQGGLTDLGVEWGVAFAGSEFSSEASSTTSLAEPYGYPDTSQTDINGTAPYNAGMLFGIARSGSNLDVDATLHAVEENGDIEILSAPRILAQDNQEASIVVGKKIPIISSKSQGSTGGSTITTTLEYYERVGIQLNVIPQICDNGMINMVVHPSVTEQDGSVSAVIGSTEGEANTPLTAYPIIQTRETETRLTVHNGDTIAIGGLISDRKTVADQKIPVLGDIPLLGRLFRRDTENVDKIELMILLSAKVQDDLSSDTEHLDLRVDASANKLLNQWDCQKQMTEQTVNSAPENLVEMDDADDMLIIEE